MYLHSQSSTLVTFQLLSAWQMLYISLRPVEGYPHPGSVKVNNFQKLSFVYHFVKSSTKGDFLRLFTCAWVFDNSAKSFIFHIPIKHSLLVCGRKFSIGIIGINYYASSWNNWSICTIDSWNKKIFIINHAKSSTTYRLDLQKWHIMLHL